MFFGLTIEKLLLIGVIAGLLIGPERLPRYAEAFARFLAKAKEFVQGARSRVREEMGPEFDEVDWQKLDPRRYDPRRIVREALLEDPPVAAPPPPRRTTVAPRTAPLARPTFTSAEPPPFDPEAT